MKRTIKIRLHDNMVLPEKHGNMWDLRVNTDTYFDSIEESTGKGILIGLGVSMTLPKGYGASIYSRSSMYQTYGIILANSVGVIEWNYGLEWLANFVKLTDDCESNYIPAHARVVQFEIYLLPEAPWYLKILDLFNSGFRFKEVDVLSTYRGGFGSTDNK